MSSPATTSTPDTTAASIQAFLQRQQEISWHALPVESTGQSCDHCHAPLLHTSFFDLVSGGVGSFVCFSCATTNEELTGKIVLGENASFFEVLPVGEDPYFHWICLININAVAPLPLSSALHLWSTTLHPQLLASALNKMRDDTDEVDSGE